MRIALDAMGGDHAPGEIVQGAAQACSELTDCEVILLGDREAIECILGPKAPPNLRVIHTSQVIGMDEEPVQGVKKKRDSSLVAALRLVAGGEADALVSAGNTGAVVIGASMFLHKIKGVKRLGIAVLLPTLAGFCVVIDGGANIGCKPQHLVQYAHMAAVYARGVLEKETPTVGLLNIGSESLKGNPLVRKAHRLLEKTDLAYAGYVEGHDVYLGGCDVVLCDGFVGNVLLKVSEGVAQCTVRMLEKEVGGDVGPAISRALDDLRAWGDYSRYGGAPLLGLEELCVICHGRSRAPAIRNALRMTVRCAAMGIAARIRENLGRRPLWSFAS